jgi:hypothetical protein
VSGVEVLGHEAVLDLGGCTKKLPQLLFSAGAWNAGKLQIRLELEVEKWREILSNRCTRCRPVVDPIKDRTGRRPVPRPLDNLRGRARPNPNNLSISAAKHKYLLVLKLHLAN